MSDYKRWVSYIYSYDENVKKNNSGYIRVETRGMITRLMVHINTSDETGRLLAYVFVREDSVMKVFCLEVLMWTRMGHRAHLKLIPMTLWVVASK